MTATRGQHDEVDNGGDSETQNHTDRSRIDSKVPLTLTELIKIRAQELREDKLIIFYPSSGTTYEGYSITAIDRLAERQILV